jgi:hypothetical protein
VYSTNLSSNSAGLKILVRMLNLNGQTGRDTMPTFTAMNFEFTTSATSKAPEPSNFVMILAAAVSAPVTSAP